MVVKGRDVTAQDERARASAQAQPSPARRGGPDAALIVLAAGAVVATVLHVLAGLRYPSPWPDEAHFLAPATNLARQLTLTAPQLNAPRGIFWVPDGLAVALAPVMALWPDSMSAARATSLVFTLVFAGALYAAVARAGGARLTLAIGLAAWLVAPRVVMMANIARMEALLLALLGLALLLAVRGRWASALAVVSVTVLVHPVGLPLAGSLVLVAIVSWRGTPQPLQRWERWLLAAVTVAWLAEGVWYLVNLDLVREHLAFQVERKRSRSVAPSSWELGLLAAAAVATLAAFAARGRLPKQRAALLLALPLLVGALTVVRITGNEMWYGVLGYETGALLGVAMVALLLSEKPSPGWLVPLALLPIAVTAWATLSVSTYQMSIQPGQGQEAAVFGAQINTALVELDGRQRGPALLALDRSSSLRPFLAEEEWRNLRLVDPTPVTPLSPGAADYLLYTLGPPEGGRRGIVKRLPASPPVVDVRSPGGTYQLLVFPAPPGYVPY